jgi:SecD/SecF fusion protein
MEVRRPGIGLVLAAALVLVCRVRDDVWLPVVEVQQHTCTTSGPEYYVFNSQNRQWLAGPADTHKSLLADLPGKTQPASSEVLEVPQGTLVVQKEGIANRPAIDNPNDPFAEWFVIHDRPALTGGDIVDPKTSIDQFNQPDVVFGFSQRGRQEFTALTKAIAERALLRAPPAVAGDVQLADQYSGHFAVVVNQQVKSRPIVNFVDNPNGIDGRFGAEINGLSSDEAQELAQVLEVGRLLPGVLTPLG